MNLRWATAQPGLPRTNFAKKWSEKDVPGGERCLTVWMERLFGTISISAVLQEEESFQLQVMVGDQYVHQLIRRYDWAVRSCGDRSGSGLRSRIEAGGLLSFAVTVGMTGQFMTIPSLQRSLA